MIVVGSEARVREVRDSVGSERIIADGSGAFAIDSGRIVAASIEAAEVPLTRAGWIDRPLEFFTPASLRRRARSVEPSSSGSAPSTGIASLLAERTLTSGEAMMALEALEASGDL